MKKTGRAAAVLGASTRPSARNRGEESKIRTLREKSNEAIAAGNLAGVAGDLANDFVVVIGDGTLLNREEYLVAFAHGFDQPSPLRYERIANEIRLSEWLPIASEQGHWVGRLADGPALFTGTYMAMWRQTEAGWKLRSELFVSLTHAA